MKNKRLALKLLAKDCELAGCYFSGGKTCAVGCLALAAGVSKAELAEYGGSPINSPSLRTVGLKIWDKFNLSFHDLRNIQEANDWNGSIAIRRKAVLKIIKAIEA